MRTEESFLATWEELRRNAEVGGSKETSRLTGVKRVSALYQLPGIKGRFHRIFSNDPMHDFAEGVVQWFIMRCFRAHDAGVAGRAILNSQLDTLKARLSKNLQWPTLKDDELSGQKWRLNGTLASTEKMVNLPLGMCHLLFR